MPLSVCAVVLPAPVSKLGGLSEPAKRQLSEEATGKDVVVVAYIESSLVSWTELASHGTALRPIYSSPCLPHTRCSLNEQVLEDDIKNILAPTLEVWSDCHLGEGATNGGKPTSGTGGSQVSGFCRR